MKKFFGEFKKFIQRGNVMDMAVGMIVGSAFTAIVTSLSNGILKPIINWVISICSGGDKDALAKTYTILVPAYAEDGVTLDLANSIYIDWGAFISAIINFLLIAFVLFILLKTFNNIKEANNRTIEKLKKKRKLSEKEKALLEEKLKKEEEEKLKKEEEERLKALEPTTNDLLKEILKELRHEK